MAINAYTSSYSATNGNPTNVYAVAELLKSADTVVVTDKFAKTIPVPMNKNQTVSLLRAVTPDVNTTEGAEGVSPTTRALTYEQVTKTFQEFDEAFAVTSRQAELGEYDVLKDSEGRLRDLLMRTREQNAWGTYRAPNNVIYNSSAITSRGSVNGPITIGRLRLASRTLSANRAQYIRGATKGAMQEGTVPMQAAWCVFAHTDARHDIENLPGYVPAPQVGGAAENLPQWIGNAGEFMFVLSPEFTPILAGGAAVGSTGMKSAGGVNIDIYPHIVFGAEALGKCSLLGMESKGGMGGIKLYVLKDADKSDPTNRRRIVGGRFWDAPVILNQNWVMSVEVGVTANPL